MILDQLGFQGGIPGAFTCAEAVEGVVALNLRYEAAIKYPHYRLPEDLNHPNDAEVTVPILDQDKGLPGAILCKVTFVKICLDQANDHLPL